MLLWSRRNYMPAHITSSDYFTRALSYIVYHQTYQITGSICIVAIHQVIEMVDSDLQGTNELHE